VRPWLRTPVPRAEWLITCFVIGALFGGGAWLYVRLQAARVDAIERLCLQDNQRSRDNRQFIHTASPRLDGLARRKFRINSDCAGFAKVAANQPPPQPGTPQP
jgi:hypothetical protein